MSVSDPQQRDRALNARRVAADVAVNAPCPECGGSLMPTSVCFPGMPILVAATCASCGREFYLDWPAGHALLHPVIVDREQGTVHVGGGDWYATRFLRCLASRDKPASAAITVRQGVSRQANRAILVDCIDFLYGHSLLKLLSVPRHMRDSQDADVVVIVPKFLAWLVPKGAVVIEVDLPLERGDEWVQGLDDIVQEVLAAYPTVRISPAVSQPEVTYPDLAALGPGLDPTTDSGDGKLQISLILRPDRLWLGPSNLALRAARRLLPPAISKRLLLQRQQRQFRTVARRVRERHPEARVVAIGLQRPGGIVRSSEDLRTPSPTPQDELTWLTEYRRSRVVVGVHGSNMLLPSALGGAVVDLLPDQKLADIGEDLIVPKGSDPKVCLFRYRILPEATAAATVAETVLSLIDDADFQHQNIVENKAAYDAAGWVRPFAWRRFAEP